MKEAFDRMNSHIVPDESLNSRVLDQALTSAKGSARFRPVAAVAAMLVLVLAATPVMAECIPWILERIAPQLAEKYDPVLLSDTDNGITIEVVAATVQDNVAELVMMYRGDALAEPVGVAPIFDIQAMGCNKITMHVLRDYDGFQEDWDNGIYYSQVILTYPADTTLDAILGSEITVALRDVRISGFSTDNVEVPVILTDPAELTVTDVEDLKARGFTNFGEGTSDGYESSIDSGSCVILPSGQRAYEVNDDLYLSGAAYIDGKLHVQMAAVDLNTGYANWNYHGPSILDAQGNEVPTLYLNLFDWENIVYREYVFDIPQEELDNYTMYVRLEYLDNIPCNCQVTFQFRQAETVTE